MTNSLNHGWSARGHATGAALAGALLLTACASAPRAPAGTLADAGIAATTALSSEVRLTASGYEQTYVLEAFNNTFDACATSRTCAPQPLDANAYARRAALVAAVSRRADALDKLGKAYAAMKTEASYDAKADVESAVSESVAGVNAYASAVAAASGVAAPALLVTDGVLALLKAGAGGVADSDQRKRLLRASAAIRKVTEALYATLKNERKAYASQALVIEDSRAGARERLISAGVVARADVLVPMLDSLGLKAVKDADAAIARSPGALGGTLAVAQAQAFMNAANTERRYSASLAALAALLEQHAAFEKTQTVSLRDLDRFLTILDAAIPAKE